MNISILLIHYNTPDLLINCLKSIYKFTVGVSFEVIIVDNASSNKVKQEDLLAFNHLSWIQNNHNSGFGVANNQAASAAKGDYLFILNTDTVLTSNVINGLYHKAVHVEQLGILAPRLMNPNNTIQYYGSITGRFQYLGNKDRNVSFISGAAMMIKKTVFEAVNGFDPHYFFYNEDIDLCTTLKRSGYKLVYAPELTLVHLGGGSTSLNKSLKKQALRSSLYFFKKHYLPFIK